MNLPDEFRETVFVLRNAPASLPGTFAIIAAWNPDGVTIEDKLNQTADRKLFNALEGAGVMTFRATGCSPDFRHREPGWAAVISKGDAIELGRSFRQLAIWWAENDDLILVDCATEAKHRVASFTARIVEKELSHGTVPPSGDF